MTNGNKSSEHGNKKLYASLFCYFIGVGSCVLVWGGIFLEKIDTISPWHPLYILTVTSIIGIPILVVWGLYRWRNKPGYITLVSLPFFIQLNLQSYLVIYVMSKEEKGLGAVVVFIFFILYGGPAILLLPGAGLLAWRLHRLSRFETKSTHTNVEADAGWTLIAYKTLIGVTAIPTLLAIAIVINMYFFLH